jgi:signal transduction histidine kinase
MQHIIKERDRLLQRTAMFCGLSFTGVSFLCLCVPGAVAPLTYVVAVALFIVLAVSQYRFGASRGSLWFAVQTASGVGIMLAITALSDGDLTSAAVTSIMQLAAGSLASVAVALAVDGLHALMLVGHFLIVAAVATLTLADTQSPMMTAGAVTLGWAVATVVGVWISAAVPQASRRIASIGRAHRAERQASELEAQRRQSARLLHDTVLATLTMLAHSGIGVAPDALRQQSADDARLLRQLRLGASPSPQSSGGYTLEPVAETVLGTTLESVKQRFGRMGLEVSWHGTGQVLLPSNVLDAFLLALAECLENVRRHSGVREAHVTIVDDATTVRAMITDAGVGFTLDDVDSARLGFKESVVGRLKEVGGHARLFSEPGSGTTVVLEVPR